MAYSTEEQVYLSQKDKTFTRFWFSLALLGVAGGLALTWMLNLRHEKNIVSAEACQAVCGTQGVKHYEDGTCECHEHPPPPPVVKTQTIDSLLCTCAPTPSADAVRAVRARFNEAVEATDGG